MTNLTIKTARENLPAEVANIVIALAKNYHTRKINFTLTPAFYVAEDAKYEAYNGSEWRTVQAGGEWSGLGFCNKDVQIPAGGFVVERRWFMGKAFISVYHNNGQEQIN